jgi:hypothetical protein
MYISYIIHYMRKCKAVNTAVFLVSFSIEFHVQSLCLCVYTTVTIHAHAHTSPCACVHVRVCVYVYRGTYVKVRIEKLIVARLPKQFLAQFISDSF